MGQLTDVSSKHSCGTGKSREVRKTNRINTQDQGEQSMACLKNQMLKEKRAQDKRSVKDKVIKAHIRVWFIPPSKKMSS